MAISMSGSGETPMSDINTTPLVDVMLVLLIIFLIAVPVAITTIERLEIPVIEMEESKDKQENLLITVSSTDSEGKSPQLVRSGYLGPSRTGECRIFIGNTTPVTSDELRKQSQERLENIIKNYPGTIEEFAADAEAIPQVHIRADNNAPWKCVAGTIYNVQAAGYPVVGFISNPINPNS